ncbi:hypothetical protein PHYBLDRAFT_138792 [Phycomyces blakesleeanus NRRL 1555(-)]|uniref:Uncharacterized protein n=1 Tax=Phycomyces blakesleeanus (strain ATCC 8743b / DSM 1359 / FGSC 10004 / NBRC 33097 / NRRL 1555) TaxID=763407 RepID=A0A167QTS6_PHYB8|nr:hypothetical protein PHYBLDRAFT_137810 [Phycomyces blakesleeanus NRRL 1555(-)]XP_018299277.1 hypothetical protein PHYBLDRAFT_138792 [Phycomyces blakesleeanus NRRL 1555(-)]OAD80264.1 hypothetical protein PHYBLDRAFT_137810 [Phycomyces blakesleeanus NRRL 1555(-)]OAD81237.1 hypothetical protein PHYBLDRAFT_138792 [Phycomyces blakesleeanus NRRL 1555(-)]|eukprot:XP_018298304.1 hypothetical protein PHYBLDRAFT_137810 [Phycomyces blakesleeanus NRRL 1555(-)]
MFLFPSDASSSQWPSGLAKDISPKIFSTAKHDHQHDEQPSLKHAMNQKLLSHAAVIDMSKESKFRSFTCNILLFGLCTG